VEEPAKIRLNAEGVKVIAAYQVGPHNSGTLAAGIKPHCPRNVIRNKRFEAVVAIAQIAVIRIGLRGTVSLTVSPLQHEQVFGVGDVQWAQYQGIQYAEYNCAGADGQGEGQHRG